MSSVKHFVLRLQIYTNALPGSITPCLNRASYWQKSSIVALAGLNMSLLMQHPVANRLPGTTLSCHDGNIKKWEYNATNYQSYVSDPHGDLHEDPEWITCIRVFASCVYTNASCNLLGQMKYFIALIFNNIWLKPHFCSVFDIFWPQWGRLRFRSFL